jgi:hypothetical protein
MKSKILLLIAVLLASSSAVPQMSECETNCQKRYSYCISSGKGSQRACLAELEKCRQACLKKEKSGPSQ